MAGSRWTRISVFLLIWQIAIFSAITNGQYSAWSSWSECSKTCFGKQTRSRKCILTNCEENLTDSRDCDQASWNSGCFSQPMIIALAVIGAAILVAVIISIILCRTNQNIKENNKKLEASDMANAIEERYDAVTNPLHSGAKTIDRRFLSVSSFPTPIQEPEEMDLDNFAFDQESLNESIQSMTLAFGTDEEYQPGAAPTKAEEKRVPLRVVSVTETQVIDRENPSSVDEEKPKEDDKPPIYAVVVKPKKSDQPKIV